METFIIASPLGNLMLTFTEQVLTNIDLSEEEISSYFSKEAKEVKKELDEYFGGIRKKFSIKYKYQKGTALQQTIWNALQTIPFGEVVSYATLAQIVGNPRAVRAVGSAVGKNPMPIIIPCHRVVGSNGGLGGFGWGLERKKKLLNVEGSTA